MRPRKNNNFKWCCLLFAIVFCSCEKVIEPKNLPEQDQRLVVNCILNNHMPVVAHVSISRSILSGKDYQFAENAVCALYEDGKLMETLADEGNGYYQGKTVPKKNSHYLLRVSAPKFESTEGSTIMTDSVNIIKIESYDTTNTGYSLMGSNGSYINLYGSEKIRIRLKDDISKKNYYSIVPQAWLLDSSGQVVEVLENISLVHLNALRDTERYWDSSFEMDDGAIVNGSELYLDMEAHVYKDATQLPDFDKVKLQLLISTISEELYRYKVAAKEQAYGGGNFFSEPVHPYSNMSNGMGIMAGSNTSIYNLPEKAIKKQ